MKKGDLIIVAVVISLIVSMFVFRKKGDTVSIYIDGEIYKKVSLSEDSEIKIKSDYGNNTVVIKDGEVSIKNSDCKGKDCETGSIRDASRSIVCLPNRLTVMIESDDKKDETDVVI